MAKAFSKQKEGMVDTSPKPNTLRLARASATIVLNQAAFKALMSDHSPKGNVLETAKVAGIMAAKMTPQIIPLCHPLEINKVKMVYKLDRTLKTVTLFSEVAYTGKTGVEMEALAAVSVAALTIYDMMKWIDKSIVIKDIKLLHKSGGKSGSYDRV